ncbi:hypothetical protein MTP99_011047 [Tenebrio molitor]|nr:hypothetical protein MTP99_011047 [Tenebrio molitor]
MPEQLGGRQGSIRNLQFHITIGCVTRTRFKSNSKRPPDDFNKVTRTPKDNRKNCRTCGAKGTRAGGGKSTARTVKIDGTTTKVKIVLRDRGSG